MYIYENGFVFKKLPVCSYCIHSFSTASHFFYEMFYVYIWIILKRIDELVSKESRPWPDHSLGAVWCRSALFVPIHRVYGIWLFVCIKLVELVRPLMLFQLFYNLIVFVNLLLKHNRKFKICYFGEKQNIECLSVTRTLYTVKATLWTVMRKENWALGCLLIIVLRYSGRYLKYWFKTCNLCFW